MGNIQSLTRSNNVDNLTYSYSGNRLTSVIESLANNMVGQHSGTINCSQYETVGNLFNLLSFGAETFGFSNFKIRDFVNGGNKAILDHMMPVIKDMIYGPKLTRESAEKWDAQMLSNEQNLIQTYYNKLSQESIQILNNGLEFAYGDQWKGKNLLNPADRWAFGMQLMGYKVKPSDMPKANR